MSAMQAMYDYTEASGGAYNGPYVVNIPEIQQHYSDGVILRSTEQGTDTPMFKAVVARLPGCVRERHDAAGGSNVRHGLLHVPQLGRLEWCRYLGRSLLGHRHALRHRQQPLDGPHGPRHLALDGCGFRDNSAARFAPGANPPLTVAPNASLGYSAYFPYPQMCFANAPTEARQANMPGVAMFATPSWAPQNLAGTPPDNPAIYDDNVPCILDCPRTSVRDDYGNPTDEAVAQRTPQMRNRAVMFLFRNRQNFTVTFRTSIGGEIIRLMDADDPTGTTNAANKVRNDLVNGDLNWIDATRDVYLRGRSRIPTAGRGFLMSGTDISIRRFAPAAPPPPPPTLPPRPIAFLPPMTPSPPTMPPPTTMPPLLPSPPLPPPSLALPTQCPRHARSDAGYFNVAGRVATRVTWRHPLARRWRVLRGTHAFLVPEGHPQYSIQRFLAARLHSSKLTRTSRSARSTPGKQSSPASLRGR